MVMGADRNVLIPCLVAITMTKSASSSVETRLESGLNAFKNGDYLQALDDLRPMAEAGDVQAQIGRAHV